MVDPERIERRLREIDARLGALRSLKRHERESFLSDESLQTQAERHLQIAIQAAIDIAVHILAEDSSRSPEDYGSAFVELARIGVIDTALADDLKLATGLRNILVHAYLDVDPGRLWDHLDSVDHLEDYAAAIGRYLAR